MFFLSYAFFLLFFSVTSLALKVDGDTVTIYDASDFIELSNNVNNGTKTYAGSTVLLGADIDFTNYSDRFEPIGIDQDIYFRGKFDGQEHTISNLHIVSARQHVSLFGVINASGFKNVVVDPSCSFTNTYNFTVYYSYTSGIVAYAYLNNKKAKPVIENLVNMAAVTFAGGFESKPSEETVITISVGGVVGFALPEITNIVIRNCANYGVITVSGHCEYAMIGGILGAFFRQSLTSKTSCSVKNCVNFGNIIHTGDTEKMLGIGGLVGTALYGIFENNMIFSIFTSNKETEGSGKVTGGANSQLTVNNCYWISEEDVARTWGYEYGAPPTPGENNKLVEANEETLNALNEWVESNANEDGSNNYSKWVMLYLDGGFINAANTNTPFTLNGLPIIAPNKPGYLFDHWCLDSDCADGPATEEEVLNESTTKLYAQWRINNFTITFDLGNGTLVTAIFTYNTTITYPDMTRVKGFYGWNTTIDLMPPYDLIIGPSPRPPKKEINAGAIAGGVIGGVAGVAIIVLVVLFIVLQKTRKEESEIVMVKMNKVNKNINMSSRVVDDIERIDHSNTIILSSEVEENPSEYLDLYSGYFKTPSIREALTQAGLDNDKVECAEIYCVNAAKRAESEGALSPAFTLDDAVAVALYTYDFGPRYLESNPYVLLNKALASGDSADVQRVRGLLYVVMRALRKLPRYSGKTLYRGLKMSIDKNTYVNGRVIAWRRLTSTSTDMKTVKRFLDSSMEHDKSTGTLFVIERGWGYNVQPYSLFPEEEEILLEPNRQFVVESVIESDVTIVNLRMLNTPLVLPEVFGGGSK